MDPIAGIISLADLVAPAALVFARLGSIFISAPILGGGQVPFQVKALITLALTVAIFPAISEQVMAGVPGPLYPLVLVKEVATGLIIGYLFGLFLEAIRFAGDIIGRTGGLAAAEMFNSDAGTMEGPIGAILYLGVSLLFFALDAHLELIAALSASFTIIPPGGLTLGPHFAEVAAVGMTRIYEIALTIALPIEGAILTIVVAEGVIARAVPQINILQLSFAIKIIASLSLLLIGLPAIIFFMGVVLALAQDFTFAFLQAAAP